MSEIELLYDFGPSWEVTRILIERTNPNKELCFIITLKNDREHIDLKFSRPCHTECIVDLFDSDHIVVSKETDSQREYGTIWIEYLDEAWIEIWCDSVEKL